MKSFFTILLILLITVKATPFVKDSAGVKVVIDATRISQVVKIDGEMKEDFWKKITPVTNFTQKDPDEGKEPTEKTEVRLAYDNTALYVAAKMFDSSPDSIVARLARKDVDAQCPAVV